MSLRLVLAATATLAFAAPALAQEAPAAAPQASAPAVPAAPKSAEELAMEAKADAFEARMAQMQPELEAAVRGSGGDQAKGLADVNVVLARYQPDIEAFATAVEGFFDAQIAASTDDAAKQQMTAARAQVGPALRGIPDQIRAGVPQAIASLNAAPATPQ
ncbi:MULTISPECIES: hypothetical protein [unclassified Brevundimonas]|uniref:hypothetical protein n=1 Tax=unclassified Brevundimonas TaxID=2622653 RepID=UPI0025BC5C4D|nr:MULTISPECIES: hypothetical protein [unclassified Brevundimonas]